jgi:hypothetical protein
MTAVAEETSDSLLAIGPRVEGGGAGWLNAHHSSEELASLQGGKFFVSSPVAVWQANGLSPMPQEDGLPHAAMSVKEYELR